MAPKATASKAIQTAPPVSSRSHVSSPVSQRFSETFSLSPFSSPLGNQAMIDLLDSGRIQPKLRVSQPGDPDELEADRVATQIVSAPTAVQGSQQAFLPIFPRSNPKLHRKCSCSGGVSKCAACEEEELESAKGIHRKASSHSEESSFAPSSVLQSLGAGRALDPPLRKSMEARFGQDFSSVRVHDNSQSAAAASSVNARAFTYGKDVVFNRGEYAPHSPGGQQLLAHELTHVVQQGAANPLVRRGAENSKPEKRPAGECRSPAKTRRGQTASPSQPSLEHQTQPSRPHKSRSLASSNAPP